jgi:hypothetical protein
MQRSIHKYSREIYYIFFLFLFHFLCILKVYTYFCIFLNWEENWKKEKKMWNSAWAESGPWLCDGARPTATTHPGWPTWHGVCERVWCGHRARGGCSGAVTGVSQVAETWTCSFDEGEWSAGNTPGMEARPKAHRGSGSLARCFGGGEAAAFRRRRQLHWQAAIPTAW